MSRWILLFLAAAWAPTAWAAFDTTNWQWRAPLEDPGQNVSGFVRVDVPPWVFDQSQAGLADLRIIDQQGNLAPHVLRWGRARPAVQTLWREVKVLNRTYEPGRYARVVVDFGQNVEKNTLQVETSGANFRRRVAIEGSADGAGYERIVEGLYLFDISQLGQRFKADLLRFPVNDFRYLRLTVFHMPDDPAQIDIVSVKAANTFEEKDELTTQTVASAGARRDDEARETICDLDLGFQNLPTARIQLDIADPHFYRGCAIEGRNTPTVKIRRKTETGWDETEREAPWNLVQSGVVYRVRDGDKVSESLAFENLSAPYRFLRIRIYDGDNPPVSLRPEGIVIHRRQAALIFERKKDCQYSLAGGNPRASAPDYDLARAVANIDKQAHPAIGISASSPIGPGAELPPWSERHKALIGVVLIVVVGAVAALLISSLRGLKKDETPRPGPGE